MNELTLFPMLALCAIALESLAEKAPLLPKDLQPYPVVANIDFAEGPIFDSQGNLYFANYLRNGTIGRLAPDGTVSVWCETGGQVNGLKVDSSGFIIAPMPALSASCGFIRAESPSRC